MAIQNRNPENLPFIRWWVYSLRNDTLLTIVYLLMVLLATAGYIASFWWTWMRYPVFLDLLLLLLMHSALIEEQRAPEDRWIIVASLVGIVVLFVVK